MITAIKNRSAKYFTRNFAFPDGFPYTTLVPIGVGRVEVPVAATQGDTHRIVCPLDDKIG